MLDVYETERYVEEYLLFHFGNAKELLPWAGGPLDALDFPVRTVGRFSEGQVARALDVGCAVGRSSFELAQNSEEVIGIDFSSAFIEAAKALASGMRARCRRLEEGHETSEVGICDVLITPQSSAASAERRRPQPRPLSRARAPRALAPAARFLAQAYLH